MSEASPVFRVRRAGLGLVCVFVLLVMAGPWTLPWLAAGCFGEPFFARYVWLPLLVGNNAIGCFLLYRLLRMPVRVGLTRQAIVLMRAVGQLTIERSQLREVCVAHAGQ